MKKINIAQAISVLFLISSSIGTVSAHDLLGGTLAASTTSVDVFRTTCFTWNGAVPFSQDTYGPLPSGETASGARGFKAAISLTAGTSVTATIGFTPAGNINGNTIGNNILPATPAPKTITIKDTTIGAPWNINATSPEFSVSGAAPVPFGTAGFLDSGKAGNGNGEYIIVISHPTNVVTKYDFIGHCSNAVSGNVNSIHTGQGSNFVLTGTQVAPTFDYEQLIDQ